MNSCLKEIPLPLNPTFIFIDGSYFCFYHYYSLLNWWKKKHPNELDVLLSPYDNSTFVDKFNQMFIAKLKQIPSKIGVDTNITPIIIVGKDCKRADIWRNQHFANYKANRKNGREDIAFMGAPFFKMVYDDDLFIQGGAQYILNHHKLEADDCIAITAKYILNEYPTSNIYIITSDKDYLQLAEERVQLFNLDFKKLTEQKSSTGNSECDLFCKILTGDPSDNIPSVFPKCGPKTAMKYFKNPELLEKKLNESETYRHSFHLNKQLIDFNYIPPELIKEFTDKHF